MGKQTNEKPKYLILKEFINKDMKFQKGQEYIYKEIYEEFRRKHPEYKADSIRKSLRKLSVNDPISDERYAFLFKKDGHTYKLYDPETDVIEKSRNKNQKTNDNRKQQKKELKPIISSLEHTKEPFDKLIDNVIIVKIGLRTLAKLLIPCVPKELECVFGDKWQKKSDVLKHLNEVQKDELIKERLDLSVCLSLIDTHWEVFRKLLPKDAYPRKVRSWINELKDDRNINAHDGIEDISYDDALRVLDTISRLCDAFVQENTTNKKKNTINCLKKYLKNH